MALRTFMKDFDLNIDNDAIQQFMKILAKRSLGNIDCILAPVSFQPKLKSYRMIKTPEGGWYYGCLWKQKSALKLSLHSLKMLPS